MKLFSLVILVLVSVFSTIEAKEVVCYAGTWVDMASKIDTSLCTVIVLGFGTLDSSGNVQLPVNFNSYKTLRTSSTKLMLALGGATAGTAAFKAVAATDASRKNFASKCLDVVKNNGLDGIDIDWEFPDSGDRANFVALHKQLKTTLGSTYLLTTAVSAGQWLVTTNNVYDIPGLAANVDWINLMTYDYHMDEGWDSSTGVYFNAPLKANSGDSIDKGINLYLQGGAPSSKLVVGVPFYGRMYQLSSSSQNTPGSPFIAGYQASNAAYTPMYNQYCPNLNDASWTKKLDSVAQTPYMYKGSQWLGYEDSASIIAKGNLANSYNLAGVMTWALYQDDYNGVCSSCKWPLLKALNSAVGRASACSGTNPSPVTNSPVSSSTTTTTTASPNGGGTITTCQAVGYFSYPSDCSKYYQCAAAGQAPYVMSCGSGLKWNNAAKYCDWNCVP